MGGILLGDGDAAPEMVPTTGRKGEATGGALTAGEAPQVPAAHAARIDLRRLPAGAQGPQAERSHGAWRAGYTAFIRHERAVVESRRLQGLEGAVDQKLAEGREDQVLAAHDLGDAHRRVVHGAGELVARAPVLAPDREVPEVDPGHRALGAEPAVAEFHGLPVGHPEAPIDPDPLPERRERLPGVGTKACRIDGLIVHASLVGGARRLDHVPARPGAGVDQARGMEALEGGPVKRDPAALVVGCVRPAQIGTLVPGEPDPAQVLQHRRREVQAVARRVQVVVAQDEGAPGIAGPLLGDPERPGMAEMEVAGGGGRKAPPVWAGKFHEFWFISADGPPSWSARAPWQSSSASTAAPRGTLNNDTMRPPRRSAVAWLRRAGASYTAVEMSA